jgi:hypothetical protein
MADFGLTATKLAEVLGYNRETVRKRLALINKTEHGAKYSWREVVDAYVEFERRSITGLDGSKVYDSDHEKARKDAAIADRYELDLKVRRGELVEAEDVKQTWSSFILRCKARLLGISTKLAPLLVAEESPKAVKALIDEEINDCLGELSKDENIKRDTD